MAISEKAQNIISKALTLLLALLFVAAGSAKLIGAEKMVMVFEQVGFGQWFRYVTGGIEVGAGIMLLLPKLSLYAHSLLFCTMIGAMLTHLVLIGGSFMPALFLLLLISASAFLKRKTFTFPDIIAHFFNRA